MIEVNKDSFRPKGLAKLVAAHHFIGMAKEEFQCPEGQVLNLDPDPILAEFAGFEVGLKDAEAYHKAGLQRRLLHKS